MLSRLFFHVLVGFKYGEHVLVRLPSVPLPSWAAGIQLGGTVYVEGLLSALALGLRLAMLVVAIGAANALANPKRLLRSMPRALHEIGTALVVSVSVAPQLAESVQRVMRARHLRGEPGRGMRAVPRVALPVLQDTLDRSLLLASAMESRGYGSQRGARRARWLPVLTLGGMLVVCFGLFEVLDLSVEESTAQKVAGYSVLAAGVALMAGGIVLSGTALRVSTYRPDPWRPAETLTMLCGVGCAALVLWARSADVLAMDLQTQPLSAPEPAAARTRRCGAGRTAGVPDPATRARSPQGRLDMDAIAFDQVSVTYPDAANPDPA